MVLNIVLFSKKEQSYWWKIVEILFVRPLNNQVILAETPRYEMALHGHYPPLGLISIATCVNEWTEHTAKVLDGAVLGLDSHQLKVAIKREKPDVVGFSSISFSILDTLEAARIVKEIDADIPVVIGGPHAIQFPFQTASYENVDYVVVGDGEPGFTKLIEHLEGPPGLRNLPGVVGKEKGKIVVGKPPEIISDLDALPVSDRTLTPYEKYSSVFAQRKPGTIMNTIRGCPYRCSFCNSPLRFQTVPFRVRSPQMMMEEVRSCAELGIKEIIFYDDTFTLQRKRIMEFCTLMKDCNLDITWDIRTRADLIDRELLHKMEQLGLRRVQMGVESGTQAGLDSIRKDITLKEIEDGFRMVRDVGLHSFGYFILGLPGETKEMMMRTISFATQLDMDYASFTVFVPFPGSPIWDEILESGDTAVRDAWENFVASPTLDFDAPTYNEYHTKEELFEILDVAYRWFYLRPKFFFQELRRIRNPKDFMMKLGTLAGSISSRFRQELR